MRQALLILFIIAALVAASAYAYLWSNSLVLSIYGYRSPLDTTPPLSTERTPPLAKQVVLVLVDGLRYDTSLQMPYLNLLRVRGAQARLVADPPSTTQTSWVTLISGAGPEINDMPLFDRDAELLQPLPIDHLFAAARRAGLSAGIAGFHWWEKLVPPESLDCKYYAYAEDDAADRLVIDHALVFIEQFQPHFLLVNLRQVQQAGQAFGGDSAEYLQAALRCDDYIRLLAEQMDLQHSVLLVVSGHGHLSRPAAGARSLPFLIQEVPEYAGGYGGDEPVVVTTPLVLDGQGVASGDYGTLNPTVVAPAIATLLGAPLPATAQGLLPTHLLPMQVAHKAEVLLALAQQRLYLGNIYLASIGRGTLTVTAEGDLLVARSSMDVQNYQSAADLAALSLEQTEREISRGRDSRLRAERLARAPLVAAIILPPLWLAWIRRNRRFAWNGLAALLAAVLYHALFLWQGGVYSFSRMPAGGLAATLQPSLRRAVVSLALGGLLVVLWLWRERQRSLSQVILSTYVYALAVLYWIGLPIALWTAWSGQHFTWYIPDFTLSYVHFALLEQGMWTAALCIVLPLPVLILQQGLLALSDWRARSRSKKEV